jgi:hypothetical protein
MGVPIYTFNYKIVFGSCIDKVLLVKNANTIIAALRTSTMRLKNTSDISYP